MMAWFSIYKVKLAEFSEKHVFLDELCILSLHYSSMEDIYPSKNHGPDSGIGSDNGDKRLSTTEVRVHRQH